MLKPRDRLGTWSGGKFFEDLGSCAAASVAVSNAKPSNFIRRISGTPQDFNEFKTDSISVKARGNTFWGRIIEANQANESQFIIDANPHTWLAVPEQSWTL